jgi:hypothetical protein
MNSKTLVELVGIELEAFSGRELVFIEDERDSAAKILSEAEGPARLVELVGIEPTTSSLRTMRSPS